MRYWMFFLTLWLCIVVIDSQHVHTQMEKCKIDSQQKSVDCSNRGLSSIPSSKFPSNTRKIDLSWNLISSVKNFSFIGIRHLTILDLSNNEIAHLQPFAFDGLFQLMTLNLSQNPLHFLPETFSSTLFRPLKQLSTLRMMLKFYYTTPLQWQGIDQGFSMLQNLQELFLNFPEDFIFGDGFSKVTRLRTLSTADLRGGDLSGCNIGKLTNDTFISLGNSSLRELQLVSCEIQTIEIGAFLPLRNLSVLDLTNNNRLGLSKAFESMYGLQHRNMDEINFSILNGALIDPRNFKVDGNDTMYLKTICVRYLDLSENYIFYVGVGLSVPSFGIPDCLEVLKISSHAMRYVPIGIMMEIPKYKSIKYVDVSGSFDGSRHTAGYQSTVTRQKPQSTGVKQLTKSSTVLNATRTNITIPTIPTLLTLNVSNIFHWMYFDYNVIFADGTNLQTLDVSYNNIANCEVDVMGVKSITQLDLSGILCDDLYTILKFFHKLRKLTIKNAPNLFEGLSKTTDASESFVNLRELQEVDLSGNKLTDLNQQLFVSNINLRSIDLSNNKLQRVPLAIVGLEKISHLDLSVNAFTHLTTGEMYLFDRLFEAKYNLPRFRLNLGLNPLQCTCDTVNFILWVYRNEIYLNLSGNYTCILTNGSRVDLLSFKSELNNLSVSCISHTWLIVGAVGILFVSLLVLLLYLVYRYRVNLRYWFYTKLTPPVEMFVQKEYVYDAFVAYCEDNYRWVYDELRVVIENGAEPLKLCFHNRDFTPGKPIHENIVDKMRQSRKIMFVISVDFLNSTYGPLEIEYAGMKSLEEGREDLIVCILLERIPVREMPKALRNLWHKITFLEWNEDEQPHFWKQLRVALTDTPI